MVQSGNETVEAGQKIRPAIPNRRRTVRQKVHLRATARLTDNSGTALQSEVIDLSEDGACLQSTSPIKPKSALTLLLDLKDADTSISATAEVVWSDTDGRQGIRFTEISEDSRQKIKQWLFANAVSVGINQARNFSATPDVIRRRESRQSFRAGIQSRQSPEQARAEIAAASVTETEIPARKDYSAILSALVEVKREVELAGKDLDTSLQLLAARALLLTRATGAAIAIATEPGADEMICRARAGSHSPGLGSRLHAGSGFSGECVRSGKVLLCDDAETDSRVDREGSRRLGIRSMMAAPVWQGDTVMGLLEVFSPNPHSFGLNDQKVLERLAEITVASMSRASAPASEPASLPPVENVSHPTLQMLPVTEIAEDKSAAPIEISRSLGPSSSSKILVIALGIASLIVLVWLMVAWGSNHAKNQSSPPAGHPIPANNAAPSTGTGVDKLQKLAEDGDPNAQFDIGARYATGEDVKQDYGASIHWFTLAAEQGHVIAQATLGAYYWAGRGIPQDLGKAYFWSAIAQAGGDEASKYRVAVLASRMKPEQVASVRHQATDWIKGHQPPSAKNPRNGK